MRQEVPVPTRFRLNPVVVGEAMHPGVITCRADTPASAVGRMMAAHRIHSVLVIGDDGACVGIIRDIEIEEAVFTGTITTRAAEGIAVEPAFVDPSDCVERAVELMHEHRTTHVVVANLETKRPVGVLSMLDVVDVVAEGGTP
jgi:CBS domain-containing protein